MLFASDIQEGRNYIRGHFPNINEEKKGVLSREYSTDEILAALKSISLHKAPRPDGYQPIFYQRSWEITGQIVVAFIKNILRGKPIPDRTADTLIALVPKVEKPSKVSQFRSIRLCNMIYKVAAKTIANRTMLLLPALISTLQSSIIQGRQGIDNVVEVREALHSINLRKGKKGSMVIKLDLDKAYDRME